MVKRTEDSIKRTFIHDSDPTPQARVGLDVNTIVFTFRDGKGHEVDKITFPLAQAFGGSLPAPGVGRAAAAFGINTSAGNAGNTVKGEGGEAADLSERIEAIKARLETFSEGRWESERASATGPRTSMVLEAIKAVLDKGGRSDDYPKFVESLTNKPELKAQFLENPKIKLEYMRLQDLRRAEVRSKLEAAAGEAELTLPI